MTKRATEAEFGKALRELDLRIHVYRPPDPKGPEGVSNWKPADFLSWHQEVNPEWGTPSVKPSWFEVKDVDDLRGYPFADLRPSQIQGIHDAERIGIPYWLAIWWRRHKEWTISNAVRVLAWRDEKAIRDPAGLTAITSIPRELLMSRFGISTSKAQLGSTLKGVLLGEVD